MMHTSSLKKCHPHEDWEMWLGGLHWCAVATPTQYINYKNELNSLKNHFGTTYEIVWGANQTVPFPTNPKKPK
jgi:hypothetical protein